MMKAMETTKATTTEAAKVTTEAAEVTTEAAEAAKLTTEVTTEVMTEAAEATTEVCLEYLPVYICGILWIKNHVQVPFALTLKLSWVYVCSTSPQLKMAW